MRLRMGDRQAISNLLAADRKTRRKIIQRNSVETKTEGTHVSAKAEQSDLQLDMVSASGAGSSSGASAGTFA